ncbi:ARF GAP-like zinc finger-containing protein [Trichomonas vaginalis G3]|uniref:ARF GAP-like zinc finger-containing protein n=1 Tax=Trichomonas vaginalis (strain ATCC PRA-98 / G3) TaxID=412133 RepID=A2D949_TRIV3|nr:GTPase activator protein [Trichomonas vaginalis G3]EAY23075.1 ARF GAP-like zinc finger-containing protein [Trichomonas vaginalis G3]KAI5519043.1 GTPase activator protein [Trichomonas vaginalis G3]|eukprot:XP_001584061.1 ARF GAP-like zinc finger-containing protein [Trichomonas vaginalis G3]
MESIEDIANRPGNINCFDCNAQKPEWCSLTYGTFICLKCAGEHRALGTHISFVRSVKLDNWKHESLHRMSECGNIKAKDAFENAGIADLPIQEKYRTKEAIQYAKSIESDYPIPNIAPIADYDPNYKNQVKISKDKIASFGSVGNSSAPRKSDQDDLLTSIFCCGCLKRRKRVSSVNYD